jgi:hypothetical protein
MRTSTLFGILLAATATFLSGCCTKCHAPPPPGAAQPQTGTIWVDHASMMDTDPDWDQLVVSSNGTDVFFMARSGPGLTFPAGALPLRAVPIQSHPGLKITGVIACVAAQGDKSDTQLTRLRLAQFDAGVRGYLVKMEAPVTGPPVGPPDAPGSFACVDTGPRVCLDSTTGTIDVSMEVQVGDADDAIRLRALGVHYDSSCTVAP